MEEKKTATVQSVGVRYGLISATIYIIFFLALALTGQDVFNKYWGWVRVPISIAIIVLAHKNFKDETNGYMTYGQGVGIGFFNCIVSLIIANLFTWLFITFIDTSVMDTFYQNQLEEMQEKNIPEERIEMAMTWTKKLFWPIALFFGLFFGMLVTFIVTIFTQKKSPESAL